MIQEGAGSICLPPCVLPDIGLSISLEKTGYTWIMNFF